VPKYLFKLVYDPSENKRWAYWVENIDNTKRENRLPMKNWSSALAYSSLPTKCKHKTKNLLIEMNRFFDP
jgi:hypothetical protein